MPTTESTPRVRPQAFQVDPGTGGTGAIVRELHASGELGEKLGAQTA